MSCMDIYTAKYKLAGLEQDESITEIDHSTFRDRAGLILKQIVRDLRCGEDRPECSDAIYLAHLSYFHHPTAGAVVNFLNETSRMVRENKLRKLSNIVVAHDSCGNEYHMRFVATDKRIYPTHNDYFYSTEDTEGFDLGEYSTSDLLDDEYPVPFQSLTALDRDYYGVEPLYNNKLTVYGNWIVYAVTDKREVESTTEYTVLPLYIFGARLAPTNGNCGMTIASDLGNSTEFMPHGYVEALPLRMLNTWLVNSVWKDIAGCNLLVTDYTRNADEMLDGNDGYSEVDCDGLDISWDSFIKLNNYQKTNMGYNQNTANTVYAALIPGDSFIDPQEGPHAFALNVTAEEIRDAQSLLED